MRVAPLLLLEVISLTPAMVPNERSNGEATEEAIVSALAPGSLALTSMLGISTCGSEAIGSELKAAMPGRAIAKVNKVVATGRLMKIADQFIWCSIVRGM
jgi:hypothetical protein